MELSNASTISQRPLIYGGQNVQEKLSGSDPFSKIFPGLVHLPHALGPEEGVLVDEEGVHAGAHRPLSPQVGHAHLDYKDFQNLFIKINRKKIKIARLLRKKRDLQSYQNLNIFLWYHDCEILVDRSDDSLLTVRSLSTCTLMVFCSFLAL